MVKRLKTKVRLKKPVMVRIQVVLLILNINIPIAFEHTLVPKKTYLSINKIGII